MLKDSDDSSDDSSDDDSDDSSDDSSDGDETDSKLLFFFLQIKLHIRHFLNLKILIFSYFSTKNICCGYSLDVFLATPYLELFKHRNMVNSAIPQGGF